jgi:hypothetical protein
MSKEYNEQVKHFLQFCKEEKDKGNKLIMGKDMTLYPIPTLKSRLIKLFKPKQR